MKKKNLLFAYFVFMTAVVMFTSCTLEKRHYRNGYYVQRTSGTFRQHEHAMQSASVPLNVALIDTAETATSKDSSVIDFNSEAVEKRDAGSSTIKPQMHTSSRELKKPDQKNVSSVQSESNYTRPDSGSDSTMGYDKEGKPDYGKIWFWIFVALMIVLISVVPLAIYVDEILAFGLFCFGTSAGIAAFVGTLTANRRIPRTTTTKATARKRSIRRLLSVLMLIITPLCGIALGFLLI